MNTKTLILSVLFSLTLSACGGGGGSSDNNVVTPPPATTTVTFKVKLDAVTATKPSNGDTIAVDTANIEGAEVTLTK